MYKKKYQVPTTKVVKLQQHGFIMSSTGSNDVKATMNSTWVEEDF